MGIKESLLGTFGIEQGEYPVFEYRGAKWYFRVQTAGDEKWAAAQSALSSLVAVEQAMAQDQLITLVCVIKQEVGGEVSYPWQEFLDVNKLKDDRKFGSLIAQAVQNPETPPVEVQRAGAVAFLAYLDQQPSGIINELIEFYGNKIKPMGDALGLTRYACDVCLSDNPHYEPPIRETRTEPPHCEECGELTRVHTVIREAGHTGAGNPFA